MKKLLALSILVSIVAPVAVATSATAATANFGTCIKRADVSLRAYQAPGATATGPVTVVDGQYLVPTAFAGGQTCTK